MSSLFSVKPSKSEHLSNWYLLRALCYWRPRLDVNTGFAKDFNIEWHLISPGKQCGYLMLLFSVLCSSEVNQNCACSSWAPMPAQEGTLPRPQAAAAAILAILAWVSSFTWVHFSQHCWWSCPLRRIHNFWSAKSLFPEFCLIKQPLPTDKTTTSPMVLFVLSGE